MKLGTRAYHTQDIYIANRLRMRMHACIIDGPYNDSCGKYRVVFATKKKHPRA
jgi:hypothetical protein